MNQVEEQEKKRGGFSSRRVFILAAVGSAVGLGNIWRFPYVAYENGGGAFLIPYIVALLVAGVPFLLFDYALGHKYRGSAPLTFARLSRKTEFLGWWQAGICFLIAVYYAAVIAWALRYTLFSVTKAWGDNPEAYFFGELLQTAEKPGLGGSVVPGVMIPLVLVWLAVVVVMVLGVQRGIGATSVIFIPVLVAAFGFLVVRSLFLPGAAQGLDALFTPNWEALTHGGVWAAAFGQIFFSLSIGFGIMITYSSYVGRKTDMTGSGLVVGFANSGFELLAGIGVFAALGFIAQANGTAVDEVVADGVGLAFVAFPAIINQAPGGALLGVLFFGSLVLAGITSLISVLEVVISAVRDKFELSRVAASLLVTLPAAAISSIFLGVSTGLYFLDIVDYFMNQFGILVVALVALLVVAWAVRALPRLGEHLNLTGSIRLGRGWMLTLATVVPAALLYLLVTEFLGRLDANYGDYPDGLHHWLGWGTAVGVIVFAVAMALLPWRNPAVLNAPTLSEEPSGAPAPTASEETR